MELIHLPDFGVRTENQLNRSARVATFDEVNSDAFERCCAVYAAAGYVQQEMYTQNAHSFAAFRMGTRGAFINYFASTRELRVVEEESCAYFDYADRPRKDSVKPQITQIALEYFGMSYVIRLSDGRFIVIDGGNNIEADCRKLFDCLKAGSPVEKPVIAAWIMTHPHSDHFHCFLGFMEIYAQDVVIERFLFNFPECDDEEHYPSLVNVNSLVRSLKPAHVCIPIMLDWIAKSGAAVYMPHTGQRYAIGDAQLEILSSMDDTIHVSQNINAAALVIRMTLGGQTILWSTDAAYSHAKLAQRYGTHLKADILQIPHHGFQSGSAEGELAGYAFIQPRICLLPTDDFIAYTFFCAYRAGTRSLMLADTVEEFITGEVERTLPLPYEPPAGAMKAIHEKMRVGADNAGARTWFFTGLSTANPDDFVFTLLNTVIPEASVRIDLYFELKANAVRDIRTKVSGSCFKQINIAGDDVVGDQPPFSAVSLQVRGYPENQPFAVRFISDIPIVVSHPNHAPAYYSSL